MSLGTSFILFFIAFIGWSLVVGLTYFIIYLKRENALLKRGLLDKYATQQSTDLKDRLVEQMKIAHTRMQDVTDEVNTEIEDVRNEIRQAQDLVNETIKNQAKITGKNPQTTIPEDDINLTKDQFNEALESYGFNDEEDFKIKH